MIFGLFSHIAWPAGTTQKQIFEDKIEQVVVGEELGFETTWMAEHHFSRYGLASSLPQFLTYLAAKTKRIRLGTAVSVLPLHNPIFLAEQLAMVDVLSDGRLDVGVGRGFSMTEDRILGIDPEKTSRMYLEAVDVLRGLWTTPGFSHHGEFYNLDDVSIVPVPQQKPHPPIYMAAYQSAANVEAAADRRLPIMVGIILDHEAAANWRPEYHKLAAARGFTVDSTYWPFQRPVFVAETEKEAQEIPREGVMWMWNMVSFTRDTNARPDVDQDFDGWRRAHTAQVSYQQILEKKALFGTPDQVAAKIKWFRDTYNIHHFIGDFSAGALEQSKVLRSMELFSEKVMPQFK